MWWSLARSEGRISSKARNTISARAPIKASQPSWGAVLGNGNFDNFDLWSGVSRSLFDDKLEVKLYNYWSPNYFGETGNNDVIEFGYAWTFGKVGHVTPKLVRNFGHQWGTLSEGGYDHT